LKQTPGCVLARITGARKGAIVDGLHDDATCDRLVELIEGSRDIATKQGVVRGTRIAAELPAFESRRWTRAPVDSTNTVAFLADRAALKLFRRIEPTPSPELEIGRSLTARGFRRTPPLDGALEYLRTDLEPGTLAVLHRLVKHQGTSWDFAIDELRRYYQRVTARVRRIGWEPGKNPQEESDEPPPFFAALEQWYLSGSTLLGRRTAELHAALADDHDASFTPEPFDEDSLAALANQMRAHGDASLDLLASRLSSLDEGARLQADAVLACRDTLLARFDSIRTVDDAGRRIRIHGDYHLGQVLRTEEDFVFLDFEGDPAQSVAERRAKQSPLKDVAGMIRSYGYAAYAALFAFGVHAPADYAALEPWAKTWEQWTVDAFLKGYMAGAEGADLLPRDDRSGVLMLTAFTLDKALRELAYELHNRPDWVRVPLAGVHKLIRSDW
jgi:maltose alpha-D-glucosyltransferase/alpha-amylase